VSCCCRIQDIVSSPDDAQGVSRIDPDNFSTLTISPRSSIMPDTTDALMAESAKRQAEMEFWEEILAVIEPIGAEPGNDDIDVVDALWIAAERGNEQAIVFWRDLATAVALDPDWGVGDDGVAVHKVGAAYDCPEKLVAAYRSGRLD
jgi:hypothetical protein